MQGTVLDHQSAERSAARRGRLISYAKTAASLCDSIGLCLGNLAEQIEHLPSDPTLEDAARDAREQYDTLASRLAHLRAAALGEVHHD